MEPVILSGRKYMSDLNDQDNDEPTSLYDLLYERSFETLNRLVRIYRRHGKEDKAAEIVESMRDRAFLEQENDAA